MSIKSFIASRAAERMFSERTLRARRQKIEERRARDGAPHRVEYFHHVSDPYSHVLAQALPQLKARFDIELGCHLVGAPQDWAAPERNKLNDYARRDAALLAAKAGFDFPASAGAADERVVVSVEAALAGATTTDEFLSKAVELGRALWRNEPISVEGDDTAAAAAKAAGDARRESLGHYLGATLHYGGEWYAGLDRLHYLEARLGELGAGRNGAPQRPLFEPVATPADSAPNASGGARDLHFYLSFRSPYTYLAVDRVKALADAYGLNLQLRYVLPMVMRALPVPPAKRNYLVPDAAREARRLGAPFGRIADPVGKPVERGYAVLARAIRKNKGFDFVRSFMTGVWSEGIDAGSDSGLKRLVERAGLTWADAVDALADDGWRGQAERNREELFELGLWGVPSFRVGDFTVWGQDRLWAVEDALRDAPNG